jgi:YD repeat-containing protein
MRANVNKSITVRSGSRVTEPPMLEPREIGRRAALAAIVVHSRTAGRSPGLARTPLPQIVRPANGSISRGVPHSSAAQTSARSTVGTNAIQNCVQDSTVPAQQTSGAAPQAVPIVTPIPTPTPTATCLPSYTPTPTATPISATPSPSPSPSATSTPTAAPLAASGTGINPWWRYQEENVPGGGHVMVNLGTGNLLLQDDDLNVAHKGVALAFRRTYNSQSLHDVNGSDQGAPGLYGNGWTNTWDAHMVKTSTGYYSVYDVDGARYDYHVVGALTADVPLVSDTPGARETLIFDGGCGMLWTKKSGTTYDFYAPRPQSTCPALNPVGAYGGRLYEIIGRNSNTYLRFTYTWVNGNAASGGTPSQITATTESGMTATLAFGSVNGHQLLQTLTAPDGSTIGYGYDGNGNLTQVTRLANNSAGSRSQQGFGYAQAGSSWLLDYASSPRWNAACAVAGCGTDGGTLAFGYANATSAVSSTLSSIEHYTVANPAISDGSNTSAIQSGYPTTAFDLLDEYYTTGVAQATYRDTDGHMTNWIFDALRRPTQTQACTASANQGQTCTGTWLVSNQTWDASNNLTSAVDPRGYQTDYAYDAVGNAIAVAQPSAATSAGTFRPTHLLSYDAYSNVLASCDPMATHALGLDWTTPPAPPSEGSGLCPQSSTYATRMQWSSANPPAAPGVAAEPFGELLSVTTPGTTAAPGGYTNTYTYDPSRQGGIDSGLPTGEQGADTGDNGRHPQQDFWYDNNGNLICYSKGNGQWLLQYDALGRVVKSADPDDASVPAAACTKSGAQAGWTTAHATTYNPDGSVQYSQTASQAAAGTSTSFAYDADGNEITETHHYGCLTVTSSCAGVTTKWYDGDDRLVEVALPYDGWDIQGYPWSTRYIYDVSRGGTTSYRGMNLSGYGNLVMTQQLLSGTVWTPYPDTTQALTPKPISSASWTPVRATAFDALDRATASYEAAFGDQAKLTDTYDTGGQAGLLSSERLATGEVKTYAYDVLGRKTDTTYSGGSITTPGVHVVYDADGRPTTKSTDTLGAETLQYDLLGAITSDTKPAALGGATISYDYFADGTRKDTSFTSSALTIPQLYQYSYRTDGLRTKLGLNNGKSFQWSYTQAERLLTQSDPWTGTTIAPDNCYNVGKIECGALTYPASLTYAPDTLNHDNFGRTSSITLPETVFAYSAISYDLEDGAAQISMTSAQKPTTVIQTTCVLPTVRNATPPLPAPRACGFSPTPSIYGGTNFAYYDNGTKYNQAFPAANKTLAPWTLDARSGMLKSWQAQRSDGNTDGSQLTYDPSGRLIGDNEQLERLAQLGEAGPGINNIYLTGTRTKAYDAENRLRSQTSSVTSAISSANGTFTNSGGYWADAGHQPADLNSVDYDADGHPAFLHGVSYLTTNGPQPMALTWLWEGNDRFAEGSVFDLDGLGTYDPVQGEIVVYDRDLSGAMVTWHDGRVFAPWTAGLRPRAMQGVSGTSPAPGSSVEVTVPLYDGKLTADGWTLDNNTWQGVRTFDPSVGQWNTPDAYAGDVHDPMSQQPFMWNKNNPYAYSDPSGYAPYNGGACSSPLGCLFDLLIDIGERNSGRDQGWAVGSPSRDGLFYPFSAQSDKQMKHVAEGHIPGGRRAVRPDGSSRSLFNVGMTQAEIRNLVVQSVLSKDHVAAKEGDRTVFDLTVGQIIGRDQNGNNSSTIHSVWDPNGNLITAYPVPDKK